MASLDGVCEECGNTGIAGEICMVCSGRIVSVDEGLDRFEKDDSISPVVKKPVVVAEDDELDDLELGDLDDDLDNIKDLDEEDDAGPASLSMEDLADRENAREDKEAWFEPEAEEELVEEK